MPSRSTPHTWVDTAAAVAAVLEESGRPDLAAIARSEQTRAVLAAWVKSPDKGAKAFRAAQAASGVDAPDTDVLAWGSVMGPEEATAMEEVERALGAAVAAGQLTPGAPRWKDRAAGITRDVLTRPLDIPPGQTLANMVVTERVGRWVDDGRHPQLAGWRSAVANRLLNPIDPPPDPAGAVGPVHWLLERAAAPEGAELTQSNYLARATVIEATERFGWWDWEKPPRSEADVHQLSVVREAAGRLHLTRRRGRRLHATTLGKRLLADPSALWAAVATETEDGGDYARMVTELVGLRLLGRPGRERRARRRGLLRPGLPGMGLVQRSGHPRPGRVGGGPSAPLVAALRCARRGTGPLGAGHPPPLDATDLRAHPRRRGLGPRLPAARGPPVRGIR